MASPKTPLRSALAALALAALTGCTTLDPVDVKPAAASAAPATWSTGAKPDGATLPDQPWKSYGDPGLDLLVARARANSPDLASAYARVRLARASAGLADSGFWPTVGGSADGSRSRSSGNAPNPFGGQTFSNFGVGGSVAYEVDLWGRVANLSKAAAADYAASHADLAAARHLVTTEVIRLWFNYRQARAERDTVAGELALRVRSCELLGAREKAGLISGDRLSRAKLEAAQASIDLENLELQVATARTALIATVGDAPGAAVIPEPDEKLAPTIPKVPLLVPSALLKTRPDIVAANLRIEAALAREGAARANFYPNLTLSASGGFSSVSSGDLLDKESRRWSLGPTVNLPLFTGGRNDAELEAARARFDADWAAYRKTVLTAFREAEDALITLDRLAQREKLTAMADAAATETAGFARERFDKGIDSNLELTLAERDATLAKREVIRVRYDRLRATANLARTLGAGWNADLGIPGSAAAYERKLIEDDRALETAKKS